MFKKLSSVKPLSTDVLGIFRIIAGILILIHGKIVFDSQIMTGMAESLSKDMGMPMPILMAYLAKGTEFFGGLLFALGLLTRFVSIPLVITMAVAVFGAHHGEITGEAEHAFIFLLVFAAYFFIGSGKLSADYLIRRSAGK